LFHFLITSFERSLFFLARRALLRSFTAALRQFSFYTIHLFKSESKQMLLHFIFFTCLSRFIEE
jgi:hypothetical protein